MRTLQSNLLLIVPSNTKYHQFTIGSVVVVVVVVLDWIDFDFLSKSLVLSALRRDCWISLLIVGSICNVDAFVVVFLIKLRGGAVDVLGRSPRGRPTTVRPLSFSEFFVFAPKM